MSFHNGALMETPDTTNTIDAPAASPTVATVVIARRPGDLSDVLGAVAAQVYDPIAVFVVGQDPIGLGERPVTRVATMAEMVQQVPPEVDYLWVVDQDARPRPDALTALITQAERVEASVAGSKLLRAEAPEQLVSVGAATDVFGVPYTGIEPGEVDQEQYDVVRDVAFVEPASMLIRRDLFVGLGGLDTYMPFESAGIDLCQRARLRGARVVVVPSAEALLVGAFPGRTKTWREQAGRIRGMVKSYSAVTLLWAIPGLFLVGLITSIADTFRDRRLALVDLARAWAWNALHLGSTLQGRRRARRARLAGDEELFRYQIRGSVELKAMAAGLSDRLANPDEDVDIMEAEVFQLPGFWQQPAFIAVSILVLYVIIMTRSLWTGGLPVTGFSLPLRESALGTLSNYAGGWNPAELGAPVPLRPIVAAAALVQLVLLSKAGLAMTVITVGSAVLGLTGTAKLLRFFGVGPYARNLAGIVLVTGPAAAFLAGAADWGGLVATGLIPWIPALGLGTQGAGWRKLGSWARLGLAAAALGAFSPMALGAAFLVLLLGGLMLGAWRRMLVALAVTATGPVALMPWITVQSPADLITGGAPLYFDPRWWVAAWIGLTIVAAVSVSGGRNARLGGFGAVAAAGGLLLARSGRLEVGRDLTVAGLVLASFGLAAVTGAALSLNPREDGVSAGTRFVRRIGIVLGSGMLILALTPAISGRLGLPAGELGTGLEFTASRALPHGPDRILLIGPSATLPGDVRRLPDGTAYRMVGGSVPHLDEAWPAPPRLGDDELADLLTALAEGGELRPGERLAEFGVRWVVFTGPSALQEQFHAQFDLRPLPDLTFVAFENDVASPRAITDTGVAWSWDPPAYRGPAGGSTVRIAENADARWRPGAWTQDGWANRVSSSEGRAWYSPRPADRVLAIASGVWVLVLLGLAFVPAAPRRTE